MPAMRRRQQRARRAGRDPRDERRQASARPAARLVGLVALALALAACATGGAGRAASGAAGSSASAASGAAAPTPPGAALAAAAAAAPGAAPQPAAAAAAPTAAPAQPLRRVRIAIPALAATAIQYYLAQDAGFFAQHGVDAEIQVVSAALGIKALIAGDFEFSGAVGTSVSAALADVPVRAVVINVDRPLSWLYGQPSLKSLADLKGKTIAVSAPGALDDANSRVVLRAAGIDADADVVFLNIGTPDQRVAPLLAGAVDAAVLALPGNVLARQAGMTELAFYGDRFRAPFAGLATSTQIIQERRDLARSTVAAVLDAVDYFNTHPAEAKASLQKVLSLEPALLDGVYEAVKLGWTADGTMDDEAMRDNIRALAPAAGADPNTDPSAVFDFSLAREARA